MGRGGDTGSARPRVFRLGLKLWLRTAAREGEGDEWRGEIYDQFEPQLREAFRGLVGLASAVMRIVGRIEAGERWKLGAAANAEEAGRPEGEGRPRPEGESAEEDENP